MTVNQSAQIRRRRAKSLRIGEASSGEYSLGEVILYESDGAGVRLEVRLEGDTVWLTQGQMAELFQRDQSVVSRHMRNVFEEGELDEKTNMQKMHTTPSGRPAVLYSLDVVVSVGYRVKSPQGTQFRIWATRTLRDHLVRGYTLNEQRLRERGFSEIRQAVTLLSRTLTQNDLVTDEGQAVLQVPLYVSAQTRAAHLLYFLIKDHPFVDGNKRIGTLLFLEYLRRHGLLRLSGGTLRFPDNAMVAIALLVAASEPSQKDLMVRLVLNLLGSGDLAMSH